MNYLQRSTAPGVTMATDFSTDAQVDPYKYGARMDPNILKLVTRHMDNGVPCLKIATPADAANEQSQAWHRRLNDAWPNDTDGFGTTPWWLQFRFKIPASRLIPWKPSGAAGWKIAIIANLSKSNPNGAPNQSSNNISHVMQDSYYRGYPTMYKHTNEQPNGTPMEGAIPGVSTNHDLDKSPGWDRGQTFTNYLDRYCCHSNKRGCPLWPVDEWITFQIRLRTLTFGGTAGNELDMWWARAGDTKWTQLLKQRDYLVGNSIPWPNGFSGIWLTTYETGRNGPGADTYALYRELIVSTKEIAMPADAPVIVPTPVPVPVPDPVPVPTSKYQVVLGLRHDGTLELVPLVSPVPTPTPEPTPIPTPTPEPVPTPTPVPTPVPVPIPVPTPLPVPPPVGGKVTPILDANGFVPESWWAGLPKDQWLEVLGTKPELLIPMLPPGFKDFANFTGWLQAWTGGAYDTATERLWLMGGGHQASSNNGLGEFDFRRMKWRWAMKPTIITDAEMAHSRASWNAQKGWTSYTMGYEWPNWHWKNGEPTALHTYGGIEWSSHLKRVLVAHRANIFHIDPETGLFVKGSPSVWISDNSSVYDDATGKWFIFHMDVNHYTNYRVFNALTNTLSAMKSITAIPGGMPKRLSSRLLPLLIGRKIVCVSDDFDYNPTINAWKMDADTEVVTDLPLINPPARVAPKKGHLHSSTGGYSPDTGLIYALQKGWDSGKWGKFVTINPTTGQCGEYAPSGSPGSAGFQNQAAPYTKFRIIKRASGTFMVMFYEPFENLRIVRLS